MFKKQLFKSIEKDFRIEDRRSYRPTDTMKYRNSCADLELIAVHYFILYTHMYIEYN